MGLFQIFTKHDALIPMVSSAAADSMGIMDFFDISRKFWEFFGNVSLREQSHVTSVGPWIELVEAHLLMHNGSQLGQWEAGEESRMVMRR